MLGPSPTLTGISDTAEPQGGQGADPSPRVLRLQCWTLPVPLGARSPPRKRSAGLGVRCFIHPGAAAAALAQPPSASQVRLTSRHCQSLIGSFPCVPTMSQSGPPTSAQPAGERRLAVLKGGHPAGKRGAQHKD